MGGWCYSFLLAIGYMFGIRVILCHSEVCPKRGSSRNERKIYGKPQGIAIQQVRVVWKRDYTPLYWWDSKAASLSYYDAGYFYRIVFEVKSVLTRGIELFTIFC